MAITDLPLLSALRTRMQWHQERQRVLAENIANSDTPNFKPRDLDEPKFDPRRLGAAGARDRWRWCGPAPAISPPPAAAPSFAQDRKASYETRPAGNAVNMEDEMMKVSANQMDYQAATSLYCRSLGLLKTAIGKR